MRNSSTWRAAFLGLVLALSATVNAGGVQVKTLDGETSGLGKHLTAAKWNLVMVWTTYCHVCRGQYPTISEFHSKYHHKDAVVLGISLDGMDAADKVSAYQKEQSHSFPSVLANADDFKALYEKATDDQFTGTPTYLLFNKTGGLHAYLDGPVKLEMLENIINGQ